MLSPVASLGVGQAGPSAAAYDAVPDAGGGPVGYGAVALLLILTACLALRPITARTIRRRRRSRSAPPQLDHVIGDLQRLHHAAQDPPQSSWVRRVALLAAYEDTLLGACDAIGVADPPLREIENRCTSAAMTVERGLARMRTAAELEAAGLVLNSAPRQGRDESSDPGTWST